MLDEREGQHAFYALATDTMYPARPRSFLEKAATAWRPYRSKAIANGSELDAERRGQLPESFVGKMDLHYSPGRTWQSLVVGLAASSRARRRPRRGLRRRRAVAAFLGAVLQVPHVRGRELALIDAARSASMEFSHVKAEVADAEALPFRAASFDTVLVFHTLTLYGRTATVIEECARVLRTGGRVVLLCSTSTPIAR